MYLTPPGHCTTDERVKVNISDSRPSIAADRGAEPYETGSSPRMDFRTGRATYPVRAPHYTELRNHGPVELARIVAARHAWLRTDTDSLLDEDGSTIAGTLDEAATAMSLLGWFAGDDDGELWIEWDRVPEDGASTAYALRTWLTTR